MLRKKLGATTAAVLCILAFGASTSSADEIAERGRAIFEANKDAVVIVQLTIKQQFSMPGRSSQSNESKSEANGTVLTADGLTVVSLSETDPSSVMESMMAGSPEMSGFKIDTEVQDVRILRSDGEEVPAEVILRDKELDMAFVRPLVRPEKPFAFVDFSDAGEPKLLDQVISISKLGKVARRAHSASVERIDAIVSKPRTFFIPGRDPTNTNLGSPAFTIDGQPIGIFLIRVIKDTSGGGRGGFGDFSDNLTTVLLPGIDILEAAAQAPPFED